MFRPLQKKFFREWGNGTWNEMSQNENVPHEAGYLMLDTAKSMMRLGWKPVYDIDEAIQKTIEWYRKYYSGKMICTIFPCNKLKKYMKDVAMKQ